MNKDTTGANEYKKVNKQNRKDVKRAKTKWIEKKCEEIEENVGKNNTKKAYQIIKDLTQQKLSRATTIQDKNGVCLTDERRHHREMDRILFRPVQPQDSKRSQHHQEP